MMNLYLDDDSADALLVRALVRAGHDVVVPAQASHASAKDPLHFTYAIRNGRVILTGNHNDFRLLHDLVLVAGGHHPGVVVVRKDNDRTRDMKHKDIVGALRNLEAAGVPLQGEFIILNHWR